MNYNQELNQRFQDLMQWAIKYWPDEKHPLTPEDFSAARSEIATLTGRSEAQIQRAPEPSEGGPQYVNVTPAPWP